MRIRVSDAALIGDLVDYLRRNGCEAIQTGSHVVAVSLSHVLPYEAARVELDFRIADWRVGHEEATAVVID
jgi:hypothetical protein